MTKNQLRLRQEAIVDTRSNLILRIFKAVKSYDFSIINHDYRHPIIAVTPKCAKTIIG